MPIQHLVFSGGGPTGMIYLGTLKQFELDGHFNISNITSIYGTSAGGILGVALCCKHDLDTIIEYLVKRPWHNAFSIRPEDLFNIYHNKGVLTRDVIDIFFKPLFRAKNISLDITMKDFYELSKIELHMYSLELNKFEVCDISYKTHPDLQVLTAVHMTSAIPVIFTPVIIGNKCFVDGGIINNYPLEYCLKNHPNSEHETLCFKNNYNNSYTQIDENSTVMDVVVSICQHLLATRINHLPDMPNQIIQPSNGLSIDYLQNTLSSQEFRQGLIDEGIQNGKQFKLTLSKTEPKIPPSVSHQNR